MQIFLESEVEDFADLQQWIQRKHSVLVELDLQAAGRTKYEYELKFISKLEKNNCSGK